MKTIYAKTATITSTGNNRSIEAEVDNVREFVSLDAFVGGNKIHFKWSGKVYVGNAHGMEFITEGPKVLHNINQGRTR